MCVGVCLNLCVAVCLKDEGDEREEGGREQMTQWMKKCQQRREDEEHNEGVADWEKESLRTDTESLTEEKEEAGREAGQKTSSCYNVASLIH